MSPETGVQIGVSRPELTLEDLPEPEEVFKVSSIDWKAVIRHVLGPSMIALGVSIGSGEWLLGPLAFAKHGFMGLGWLITLSAVLQTFYNMEVARFTVATGEVPSVAFMRVPPGKSVWVVLTLAMVYLGWIGGGWASAAGQSLFAFFAGRAPDMRNEIHVVRLIGIGLMALSLGLYLFGKKISRTLEIFNAFAVWVVLFFVVAAAAAVVPLREWGRAAVAAVVPARVPGGIDATLLGAIVGYTGFAAGFNFMLINYYRDKGYGMGHRVGYIAGLIGGRPAEVKASGVTFPDTPENARRWGRWWKYLSIDQWSIFFAGALAGMFIPCVLVAWLANQPGAAAPSKETMPTYAAAELGRLYGGWLFPLTLLVGAFTLFKTQATILEMLIRNTADAAYALFPRLHAWTGGDARKFYYATAVAFLLAVGGIMHLALPTQLVVISANMANLASLVFPPAMIYLNLRLPRPARIGAAGVTALVLNMVFFGFFFVNFVVVQVSGRPLVQF